MRGDVPDTARLLRELDARRQIADLVHRYAFHVRNGDPGACADLLHDGITFTIRERDPADPTRHTQTRTALAGKEQVLEYICRSAGGAIRVFPIIHNLLIDVQGDSATSNCMMASRTWPTGHEFLGEYDDEFVCISGSWRLAGRTFTIFKSAEE